MRTAAPKSFLALALALDSEAQAQAQADDYSGNRESATINTTDERDSWSIKCIRVKVAVCCEGCLGVYLKATEDAIGQWLMDWPRQVNDVVVLGARWLGGSVATYIQYGVGAESSGG